MKKLIVILFCMCFLSCDSDRHSVYFVQLNDVYEIAPLGGGLYGGMARVAHVVDSLKSINPNTFLFMSGDFLNPSLIGNLKHDGVRIKGRQMIEVMNAMDFTMVTFGNHEFDLTYPEFQSRLDESTFDWVNTNCYHQTEQGIQPFARNGAHGHDQTDPTPENIPEVKSMDIEFPDGRELKLGFFGVTIPSNPKPYVYYADMYHQAGYAVDSLNKMGADILVGLTHVNLEMDQEIARQNPDLDLILGGHEHNHMKLTQGNTTITKSDANAKNIYVHELIYDFKSKSHQLESTLLPINQETPENQGVAQVVQKWDDVLYAAVSQVSEAPNEIVLRTSMALDGRDAQSRSTQTNLGQLITRAMTFAYEQPADGAIVNGGSIRLDDYLQGEVTALDFFRVLPFGDGVLKVQMTGALLSQVLAYGQSQRGDGAYLHRFGMGQNDLDQWTINGKLIEAEKSYWIATSEFLMRGFDIPFLTPEHPGVLSVISPEAGSKAVDIRTTIIEFLKNETTP